MENQKKDFDGWNEVKKEINEANRAPVKLGEIYWCNLGLNIGVEQNGGNENFQRPIIVIHKFSKELVLIAPLTTKIKKGSWFFDIQIRNIKQQVILSQIRPIDTKRLTESLGEISEDEIKRIVYSFYQLIKSKTLNVQEPPLGGS